MSLFLLLLLVLSLLLITPLTTATTSLLIPSQLPISSLSNHSSLLHDTPEGTCPTSTFCFPDFAYTINGQSLQLGCWSCSHNSTCDQAWYDQPGVYCGTGSGTATVNGQQQRFSYLGFCCPSNEYQCTNGYQFYRDDSAYLLNGYGCVKPEAEESISTAGLISLVLALVLLTTGLTILAFLFWRRQHPHSTLLPFHRSAHQPAEEEEDNIPPPGQAVVPAPWPGDLEEGPAAAAPPAPPQPPAAATANQSFRLDQSIADPSAYQRME